MFVQLEWTNEFYTKIDGMTFFYLKKDMWIIIPLDLSNLYQVDYFVYLKLS